MLINHLKKIFVLLTLASVTRCIHPDIALHKAKLLDPMMDPAKTQGFYANILSNEASATVEHGAAQVGGSLGASCPSCGR